MNIPKSHSVPAIIISDFDYEDQFLKLKPAEAKNKIQNKIITTRTNSFEEKQQIETKKTEITVNPANKKSKVGSHFLIRLYKVYVYLLQNLPRSGSFENEASTTRSSGALPAAKQKSSKKFASSFNKVRSNTKLQKNIQDSIVEKEKLCETIGEDAF